MNGFFNVLKPAGMSSAAVVAIIRRLTGEKRVGHGGTLDPEASGVLPVMVGKAARLFDFLADKEKEYIAVCAFGSATDTQDATGKVLETGTDYPGREQIIRASEQLTGVIRQVPSMYSAIKVNGKPLYARARNGETVQVPERTVRIGSIELLREMPDHAAEIRVRCGRGTYIRTLCHDLGKLCGCPAHMRSLVRTQTGPFRIEDAMTPEEAKEMATAGRLAEKLLPPDYPLAHLERADVPGTWRKRVVNGARIPLGDWMEPETGEGSPVRVYLDGRFWGVAVREKNELAWKAQIAPED